MFFVRFIVNMIMHIIVVAFVGCVLIGCDSTPVVESRCDDHAEYSVVKSNEGFRLHLMIGLLVTPHGCTNGLSRRRHATSMKTSVKSLDEAHKVVESEIERYKQAHPPEQP